MNTYITKFTSDIIIQVDQQVIDHALSEDFKKEFYDFDSAEAVVNHLAFNMLFNHITLNQVEGFAGLDNALVVIEEHQWHLHTAPPGQEQE